MPLWCNLEIEEVCIGQWKSWYTRMELFHASPLYSAPLWKIVSSKMLVCTWFVLVPNPVNHMTRSTIHMQVQTSREKLTRISKSVCNSSKAFRSVQDWSWNYCRPRPDWLHKVVVPNYIDQQNTWTHDLQLDMKIRKAQYRRWCCGWTVKNFPQVCLVDGDCGGRIFRPVAENLPCIFLEIFRETLKRQTTIGIP